MKVYLLFLFLFLFLSFPVLATRAPADIAATTSEALLAYPMIAQKTQYWVDRVKKLTLGDYADDVLIIAPIVTGQVQFKVNFLDVNLNYYQQQGSVNFTHQF